MKDNSTVTQFGCSDSIADKIAKYGWTLSDKPGEMKWINKEMLEVDKKYQRAHSLGKVQGMASEWSWVACGTITVGKRDGDGYYIIDGQHRTLAALRRSDITELPCIVFGVSAVTEEAIGFVRSNTHRKAMSVIDKHRANLVAKDKDAIDIQEIFDAVGTHITKSDSKGGIKCVGTCYFLYKADRQAFIKALKAAYLLSDNNITDRMLGGLWYISHYSEIDISEDSKFYKRLAAIPNVALTKHIAEAVSYYVSGGNKVCAVGILNAVNKGLRRKYKLIDTPQE